MSSHYLTYYNKQIGGGGITDYGTLYKIPYRIQKGRGIGSIFSGLFRFLKPYVLSGLNAVTTETLKQGSDILHNIGTKPFGELVKEKSIVGLQNLAEKAVKTMSGGRRKLKRKLKCMSCIKGGKLKRSVHSTTGNRSTSSSSNRKRKLKTKKHHQNKKLRVLDIFN